VARAESKLKAENGKRKKREPPRIEGTKKTGRRAEN
jgi:hypothetical protein